MQVTLNFVSVKEPPEGMNKWGLYQWNKLVKRAVWNEGRIPSEKEYKRFEKVAWQEHHMGDDDNFPADLEEEAEPIVLIETKRPLRQKELD